MTKTSTHTSLTRRERQIMDVLYRRGRATAAEVMAELTGEPNYSTVRTQGTSGTRRKAAAMCMPRQYRGTPLGSRR